MNNNQYEDITGNITDVEFIDVKSPDVEFTEYDELLDSRNFNTDNFGQIIRSSTSDDTLQLIPYEPSSPSGMFGDMSLFAEYKDIDAASITIKQEKEAKSFVSKVKNFISLMDDKNQTPEINEYLEQIAVLQLNNLSDIMALVDMNKQLINNVVARINASQAEDYAILNAFSNLVNQHIKLTREFATVYKSIPSTFKKMRQEILTDSELGGSDHINTEIVTQNYGETQFGSQKEMLKRILEKRKGPEENVSGEKQ